MNANPKKYFDGSGFESAILVAGELARRSKEVLDENENDQTPVPRSARVAVKKVTDSRHAEDSDEGTDADPQKLASLGQVVADPSNASIPILEPGAGPLIAINPQNNQPYFWGSSLFRECPPIRTRTIRRPTAISTMICETSWQRGSPPTTPSDGWMIRPGHTHCPGPA